MSAVLAPSPIGRELLDDIDGDPEMVAQSLGNIARANWWFGGTYALSAALDRLLSGAPQPVPLTLLDIGTGDGDLPLRAVRWGRRRGVEIQPVGLERNPIAARIARTRDVECVLADAGALPFRDKSVDIVMMNLFLHHFATESAVTLLAAADRLARIGVIVSDLQSSRVASTLFGIGARLLRFDSTTIIDGQTSIARGYSKASLAALLASAGVHGTVHRAPGWRLVAQWRSAAA